jgi:hypothetical protein
VAGFVGLLMCDYRKNVKKKARSGRIVGESLGSASPINQQQASHFPSFDATALRRATLPTGGDGRGRISRIVAQERASGHDASVTRGRLFCFGNERAKPLAFPPNKGAEAISLPQPQRGKANGTLARRDAGGRCGGKQSADKAVADNGAAPPVEANARPSLARQGERQERQRVSPKTPHP